MPIDSSTQLSFSQGELGPYVEGRSDLDIYKRGLAICENWMLLPQGGAARRSGFEYVATLGELDPMEVSLRRFDFGLEQQYLLVFSNLSLAIYRDKTLAATISTPWRGEHVRALRMAQSTDTLVIAHPDYPPRLLERLGSDTDWAISEIEFDAINFFRFNTDQELTPSATTGNITLTLSPADAYWQAGHVGVRVRVNPDADNKAYAEITGFQQDATGGTAYSSAGTAANAFDANPATTCNAGATGWIGYGWGAAKTIRVVGIKSVSSATVDLVFETDDNSGFSSATNIATYTGLKLVADEWVYLDLPDHAGETHARIRLTTGTLDVKDVVFNEGVVVTATVGATALASTNADPAWREEAWNAARGFPRSVTYHQQRLVFGGTRDAPDVVFASRSGDYFNFDDSNIEDDYAFAFALSTDQQQSIQDIKSQSKTLKIFSTGGEFNLNAGDNAALTPTSVQIDPESSYGASSIPAVEVDSELFFITANKKEVRSFVYSINKDGWVAQNFTRIAHHLFDRGRFPLAAAYLRSFKDTQSNYLFVPRSDGEMAVFSYVSTDDILGWSRWTTQGSFYDVAVVSTDHGDGERIDTLYALVQRETGLFIEALTEDKVFVDHWYVGASETPKTDWSGLTTLEGQEVQVVADGFVQPSVVVEVGGGIDIASPASNIVVGLGYESYAETLDIVINANGKTRRGDTIILKQAIVSLLESLALTVQGRPLRFRNLDSGNFNDPLEEFTGDKVKSITGRGTNQSITLSVTDPLQCTVTGLTTVYKVGL